MKNCNIKIFRPFIDEKYYFYGRINKLHYIDISNRMVIRMVIRMVKGKQAIKRVIVRVI